MERAHHLMLEGAGEHLKVVCPEFFATLLQATLNGWAITLAPEHHHSVDILVAYEDEVFQIDALVLDAPRQHRDMIDTLNEFFLCLSYLLCAAKPSTILLHCAAFVEGSQNHIVVGEKNRGKSTLVYQKAAGGTKILADDLLLWDVPEGVFMTLGLPLRMRRPLFGLAEHPDHKQKFLAGRSIAYSRAGGFNIAGVGECFALDALFELSQERVAQKVNLLKLRPALKKFSIAPTFSTLKKSQLSPDGADGQDA
ncbi:hypothetical protein RYZ20_06750 [Thioclava sp. A2]|uniref:hypothetical protein n=1 Tax=Thioclava sp. FCG-A2 TaxID=3080562 RepID=UPI002955AA99|nr:hypothetical protein [Thioclava sp. A2]MDV7270595.1 hypothetical protein [Thioclava sp. A2]